MKNLKLILSLAVMTVLGFTSCEDSDISPSNSIEGTYVGTLTINDGLKSTFNNTSDASQDGTAVVSDLGNGQIEIHCFGSELDTTFTMNYYENNDSIMLCHDDAAFEEMYGHMMGSGSSSDGMMGSGGMMSGTSSGQSEWMNHMNEEHSTDDLHFGGFDMRNQTFDYTIKGRNRDYQFLGSREQTDM